MQVSLSYVLTTYNKLSYLKITLPCLIAACREDEEIVVVDGGSTDGTKDYLESLYKQGQIHQFISEKDFGEAHGTNKAILMAKGELIKIITDDDAYDFNIVQACKIYLLQNPAIDLLVSNVLNANALHDEVSMREVNYSKNLNSGKPFLFCGLTIFFRKKSLSLLGLFNPLYKIIDMEYSLRVSAGKNKICFYEGFICANISNPASNSVNMVNAFFRERQKLYKLYHMPVPFRQSLLYLNIITVYNNLKKAFGIKGANGSTPDFETNYKKVLTALTEKNLTSRGFINNGI